MGQHIFWSMSLFKILHFKNQKIIFFICFRYYYRSSDLLFWLTYINLVCQFFYPPILNWQNTNPQKTLRNVSTPLCKYFYEIHLCRLLKITFDLFLQYTGTIKAGSRHFLPSFGTESSGFLSEFWTVKSKIC